ncbi:MULTISPECIES: primosomal protein DnaI [Bacillaceae]|uniref:primosomal protein DnaI n=1 Tax=Bacillaceae TaxID=186817 RepID=UPI000BFD858F|nr:MULTISPECIES: primosomal protein DnaI [Bacillaceae]MCM3162875.1 primosomal protein DnaI [Metabacillus litoralis]MCM3411041.1 primosomal protein DnaI [Metabacillus litoralis]PGT91254.1 primosomal protein DnaI [Bacillus sp. AFS040349]
MEHLSNSFKKLTNRSDFNDRYNDLKKEVLNNPDVQAFITKHSTEIEEGMINRSLVKLYEFVNQSKNCKNCPSLSQCKNILEGYHPHLVIQGRIIDLQYTKCPTKEATDERKKHEALIKSMYIPKDILEAQFDKIDVDVEETSRLKVIGMAQDFVEAYNSGQRTKGLYLYGSFGVGKTYILGAIANELASHKVSSMLVYVPEFMRELKGSFQNSSLDEKLDAVKKIPVLMLDDLGAESVSSWMRDEILGTILQYRMLENLPTFISSNFGLKELQHHLAYSQRGEEEPVKAARIMERIKHMTIPVELVGRNRRG